MDMHLKDTIGIYPNAFSDEFCDELTLRFEEALEQKLAYEPAQNIPGNAEFVKKHVKHSMDWTVKNSGCFNEEFLVTTLESTYRHYMSNFYTGGFPHQTIVHKDALFQTPQFFELFQIARYKKGEGHYNAWHIEQYNFETARRIFIFLLYLNDVKKGGETEFLYAGLKVKPKKGTLIIHPAGFPYMHRGNVPVSNDKTIIVSLLSHLPVT